MIWKLAAISLALCGCNDQTGSQAAPPQPSQIAILKADPAIQSVKIEGRTLAVRAVISDAGRELDYLLYSGRIIKAVAVAVQSGAPDLGDADRVRVEIIAPIDSEGLTVMGLFLDASTLRAAAVGELANDQALNLVSGVSLGRAGVRIVTDHCGSERGMRQNSEFCGVAQQR